MYFDFVTQNNLIGKLRLAKELKFTDVCVLSKEGIPTPTIAGIHTPTCLLVTDEVKSIGRYIAERRKSVELVAIASSNRLRLIKSIQDDKTDIIIPDFSRMRLEYSTISLCKRHKVAILFGLRPLLKASGLSRASLVKRYSHAFENLGSCKTCIGSLAVELLELRAPKEITNFFHHLGLPLDKVKQAITETPKRLVHRNRKRQKLVAPGVLRL